MAAAGRRDDGPGGDATGGAGGGLRNALRGDLGCLELPGFPRISGEFKMVKREKIWKNWRFMVVLCVFRPQDATSDWSFICSKGVMVKAMI